MKKYTVKSWLLVVSLLSATMPVQAQQGHRRDDPEYKAQAQRHAESVGLAFDLVLKARAEMNLRHFDKTMLLCDRAIQELTALGGDEYAVPAHEVLAETALLQGHPLEALRQTDACKARFMVQRFGMTRALALIAVGRKAEARAMVLNEVGTPEKPGPFRNTQGGSYYPIDRDPSDAALAASAYFIRASWLYSALGHPEVLDDMKAATALLPADAELRFKLGASYFSVKSYEAARAQFVRAKALAGGDEMIWKASTALSAVDKIMAQPTTAKSGG